VLHPFMPFLTEDIWQYISERTPQDALMISQWPQEKAYDKLLISEFDFVTEVISGVRTIRKEKNISFNIGIKYQIQGEQIQDKYFPLIDKLTNAGTLEENESGLYETGSFTSGTTTTTTTIYSNIEKNIEEEIEKLEAELQYTEGFLKSVQKKLTNERFVAGAPEPVIANERKKEADALAKIETLKASLESLG
ncbi:MAG: class I tRNA ligase family protein, partial [Flavobacteriales bacterium]|nr:class I tRNA ligase family protein [Flavobacteriales bacterium]